MFGWNFPSNNYGQETGLNDAGIETFNSNPLESLAREIIQNSCDAKNPYGSNPVEVHFTLHRLPKEDFPDRDDFIKILEACKNYWNANSKAKKFFEKAIRMVESPVIPVLRISDFNTVGLSGSDKEHGTDWYRLIKSVGVSDKSSQAGGSFGIGKHAPFTCSHIRTVFYGTRDLEGKTAFQGVAKLVTHNNSDGPTQGTGYYGVIEKNLPIKDFSNVNEFFVRSSVGTDVFVAGFKAIDGWQEQIIKSVLENFFIAIHEKRLIVKVEDITIDSASISTLLSKFTKDDEECLSEKYYKALTAPDSKYFSDDNFHNYGKVELYVLPAKELPKRVAMVRDTGMKIYDKTHIRTPMKFIAVMIARGEELNKFLRLLEPPTHNAWEYKRHDDPKLAKKLIDELNKWVLEQIHSLSRANDSEELDVEGISQFLPDENDDVPLPGDNNEKEGEKGQPKVPETKKVERKEVPTTKIAYREVSVTKEVSSGATTGRISGDSMSGAPESSNPEPPQSKPVPFSNPHPKVEPKKNGGGTEPLGGPGIRQDKKPVEETPLQIKRIRSICIDPDLGKYRITFEPNKDGECNFYINIVGEVGKEPAPIKSAINADSEKYIQIIGEGQIGPIHCVGNKKNTLVITLRGSIRCALEVSRIAS